MRNGQRSGTGWIGWVAAAITLAFAGPAGAQETRVDEHARRQADKVLAPNLPTKGERAFEWLEDYMTSPQHWFVTLGTVAPGSGIAPGAGYRGTLGHARINAQGAWSVRGYRVAETLLTLPLSADRVEVTGHARLRDGAELPFYGIGSESIPAARSAYGLKSREAGVEAAARPRPWLRLAAGTAVLSLDNGAGKGRFPSIDTVFDAASAPGLMTGLRYVHSQASVAVDRRESPGYTRSGGFYSATLHHYDDRDAGLYSFRQLDVDARQFIPLMNEHWVIALRGGVSTTDRDAGQQVPFFLMPSLGSNQTLRGYRDLRFRDQHAMLMSAEYRWIPGRILDMALFVDAGKVASRRQDLNFTDLKASYGIGARFHAPAATVLRIDTAHGDEGFMVRVTFGPSF
jgi:hypothetical protein